MPLLSRFSHVVAHPGTVLAVILLVWWELHVQEPVINFRILRNVSLSTGSALGLLFGIAFFGTTFSLPALRQNLLRYSAFQSGLVLLPRTNTLLVSMLVVGWNRRATMLAYDDLASIFGLMFLGSLPVLFLLS
jgi:hypothetical protein